MPEILIKELIDAGVDGIEVIHPSHSPDQVKCYRGIVNEYFLLDQADLISMVEKEKMTKIWQNIIHQPK